MPPLQGYNARLGGATVVAKLIRNGSPYYRAVLFVRADSKYSDLPSLRATYRALYAKGMEADAR